MVMLASLSATENKDDPTAAEAAVVSLVRTVQLEGIPEDGDTLVSVKLEHIPAADFASWTKQVSAAWLQSLLVWVCQDRRVS